MSVHWRNSHLARSLIRWAQRARGQAETPHTLLSRFPEPALSQVFDPTYELLIFENGYHRQYRKHQQTYHVNQSQNVVFEYPLKEDSTRDVRG